MNKEKANELSIEEKAKRYDDVIEKFDVILNLNTVKESGTIFADDVRKILPELREIEDEEIRKAMIDFFKHEREEGIAVLHYGVNIERMIAWLEKQGEQNLANSAKTCKDEQKPTENKDYSAPFDIEIPFGAKDSELIQETIRIPDGCYAFIEGNEIVIKKGEKPAEWSKEDERKISRIYSILGQAADTHAFSTTCRLIGDKECVDLQDFLKSLKARVSNFDDGYKVGFSAAKYNQWKPSDEQIKALEDAIEFLGCTKKVREDLKSLYEQLKKLREE